VLVRMAVSQTLMTRVHLMTQGKIHVVRETVYVVQKERSH
jgi:hypothetical protein